MSAGLRSRSSGGSAIPPGFGPDAPGIAGDRSRQIDLGLDRPEPRSRRDQGIASAPGRAIDQRHRPAAMHSPHRIEQMIARLALECREAIGGLGKPERQSLSCARIWHRGTPRGQIPSV